MKAWQTRDRSIVLYCGDNREALQRLAAESIDCVVTSPPFNQDIGSFSRTVGTLKSSDGWKERISEMAYDDSLPERDYQAQQVEILDALFRVAAPHASCFYQHKNRHRGSRVVSPWEWLPCSEWVVRQELTWERSGGTVWGSRMFCPNDEKIFWLRKGRPKWNKRRPGTLACGRFTRGPRTPTRARSRSSYPGDALKQPPTPATSCSIPTSE